MTFSALPIDQRPYVRFAALTPSDTTVYDPPTDAIMLPQVGGTSTLEIVGSDDVSVAFTFGTTLSDAILPLSVKKVAAISTITPIGLWRD